MGLICNQSSLVSVITVVFNNVKDIERTLKSVINQTYKKVEYIVIDGGSTDGTLEIINKYKENIAHLVSEPDKGIYDAMNKGLDLSTGEYVVFINSGDEIYDVNTIQNIFSKERDADIYYGETEMFDSTWKSLGQRRHKSPKKLSLKSFRFGMSVSHQAIYVRRDIASNYDLTYRLSADIDWILDALTKAKKVVNVNMYVAKYLVGGMSKKKHKESLIERFKIFSKYYGLIPNLLNHILIAFNLITYFIKNRRTND